MIGCSDSSTLSSGSTLAPLDTTSTPATTSTVTVTTPAEATTTLPGTAATMTPTLNPRSTTPSTVAPETTTPVTSAPEATTAPPETTAATEPPPATTLAPTSCQSCRTDYTFPYASFFAVPQFGTEPVRGTGCGADSSIGEVIPDGTWDGHITVGSSSLKIDLHCIYYGASAAPYIAQCEQTGDADSCLEYGDDFWIVNNSTRIRTVPLDPSFRRRYATSDGCADPGPGRGTSSDAGADAMDSWVVIEGGKAAFALTSCVYG